MKIMQINAVYGIGSTGVIVQDIHEMLLSRGVESHVAYSTSPKNANEITNGYIIGNTFDKKIHALLSRINGKQAYFSRLATRALIKKIKVISPDIVHIHNVHSNFLNLNMLLAHLAKSKVKTVINLHDCWFYTGGCFHYTSVGCDRWLRSCGKCPKKGADTPALLFDKSAQILKDRRKYLNAIEDLTLVGVSQWITDESARNGIKANRVVVYNGVDTSFFKPTPSDIRCSLGLEDKFVVLGPANKWLKPINRETLDFVTRNLGDDSALVLLGCSDKDVVNLPGNVIALDYIRDRDRLRKVYSMADVFANCTREESLSLINAEAQACGTPVVTYRNTGVQETVDEQCGFSVENGNVEQFVDAILKIKNVKKETLSADCRKWAIERFDRDKNYEKYVELYNSLR